MTFKNWLIIKLGGIPSDFGEQHIPFQTIDITKAHKVTPSEFLNALKSGNDNYKGEYIITTNEEIK